MSAPLSICLMMTLASLALAAPLPQYSNGDGSSGVDTTAGASGTSTSFNLSTGAIVAIVIVVVIVIILGVASTWLWVEAKRRNETMSATLARASRRVTGRFTSKPVAGSSATDRRSRRTGLQMSSVPTNNNKQGHKRGLVVQVTDVQKPQNALRNAR